MGTRTANFLEADLWTIREIHFYDKRVIRPSGRYFVNIPECCLVLYSINAVRLLHLALERTVGRRPSPLDRPS